jgi:hypothetical protein
MKSLGDKTEELSGRMAVIFLMVWRNISDERQKEYLRRYTKFVENCIGKLLLQRPSSTT